MTHSVAYINQQFLFEMPPVKAQAGLLLGARSASGAIARTGARLIQEGRVQSLILCGGVRVFQPQALAAFIWAGMYSVLKGKIRSDFLTAAKEADQMRRTLLREGVKEANISFMENRSTNTGENVENAFEMLRRLQSANIVTVAYLQRRALGTIRKHPELGALCLTSSAVYPFGIRRSNWHEHKFFADLIFQEAAKLDPKNSGNYFEKGYCLPVNIQEEIRKWSAGAAPRPH